MKEIENKLFETFIISTELKQEFFIRGCNVTMTKKDAGMRHKLDVENNLLYYAEQLIIDFNSKLVDEEDIIDETLIRDGVTIHFISN